MASHPADRPAFQAALAKAVPTSARRFAALVSNQRLVNWRPDGSAAA